MKPLDIYVLGRRVSDDMVSRGPWSTERAERIVRGFYKFNPPQVIYDREAHDELRQIDPGLPEWSEFCQLLRDSYLAALVRRDA